MKQEIKIVIFWLVTLIVLRLTLLLPHHNYIEKIGFINIGIQLLLFILSVLIAKNSQGSQRYVFINFSIFFGFIFLLFLNVFVGKDTSLFTDSVYANILYAVYVNKFGFVLCHFFVILFLAVDYLFSNFRTKIKYMLTAGGSLLIVGMIFLPFLVHPFDLYDAEEYIAMRRLSTAHDNVVLTLKREPDAAELVNGVQASILVDRVQLPQISRADAQEIVKNYTPFQNVGGYITIFWRPLERLSIYINSIALAIVIMVLIFFYKQNKPLGAYIDKIFLLLFMLFSLEILHAYGSMQSDSLEVTKGIYEVGQYATILNFLVMVYAFDLKRRFVCSVTGKYYEHTIEESPERITRWRDELDNYILKSFLTKHGFIKQLGLFSKVNNKTHSKVKT